MLIGGLYFGARVLLSIGAQWWTDILSTPRYHSRSTLSGTNMHSLHSSFTSTSNEHATCNDVTHRKDKSNQKEEPLPKVEAIENINTNKVSESGKNKACNGEDVVMRSHSNTSKRAEKYRIEESKEDENRDKEKDTPITKLLKGAQMTPGPVALHFPEKEFLQMKLERSSVQEWSERAKQVNQQVGIGGNLMQWIGQSQLFVIQLCKQKHAGVDSLIEQLKLWYPQQRQRFTILATTIAKCHFLMDNYGQLQLVAKNKQSPQICHLLEKTKCFLQDVDTLTSFMDKGQHHSVTTKLMSFATLAWTVGELDPSDYTLFMRLFAFWIRIKMILSTLQLLVCTTFKLITMKMLLIIHRMPIFRIILLFSNNHYFKKKYSVWNNKENVCINYPYDKLKVSAWYAEPDKCNVFHCITLFTVFVHLFLNDHLNGTQLQQTNSLEIVLGLIL
ncbi:hypothetical protein RFI_40110 [Reticulomyxa filosa]|uniref:Uncharacterized protein n=1 Tax=Reticulomyxa filosa TaxID=46433 RepID=X6L9P0_RETFI|nr:hypothetical protein RFI_40110 [Reticulomyxa filosa]|eukprot:ETN97419.1 hypothetical protein RFI_40110 [Reticulomyxa filosa]